VEVDRFVFEEDFEGERLWLVDEIEPPGDPRLRGVSVVESSNQFFSVFSTVFFLVRANPVEVAVIRLCSRGKRLNVLFIECNGPKGSA
jgi:hypothetical protein